MEGIKGFKVFNPDWTCDPAGRPFQYEVGKTFEEDIGMHFCKEAKDCFNYYSFNPDNKVAEIIAYGDIVEEGDKCCTNKLEIVRELSWQEVLTIVNKGMEAYKEILEKEIGPIGFEEFDESVIWYTENFEEQNLYPDSILDYLSTYIHRRRECKNGID